MLVGYHASHEQFAPSVLLGYVQRAEEAGFHAATCSDHFHPWSNEHGESGFAWAWLGAALAKSSFSFGVVNAPGQRYHPAIIAQAAATLEEMFPGRFWIAPGSGQALNEHITGDKWPIKEHRNERLHECVEIFRSLWRGETVTHYGHVTVENARLYTRPVTPPRIIGAAVTAPTAQWMAPWVDGLITVSRSNDKLQRVVAAFRENGGGDKPLYVQSKHSWAETYAEARERAWKQWKTNVFASKVLAELDMPEQFEKASKYVRPEDVEGKIFVSEDAEAHAARIQGLFDLGFDGVYLHNVGRNQEAFIDAFGEHVLPHFPREDDSLKFEQDSPGRHA